EGPDPPAVAEVALVTSGQHAGEVVVGVDDAPFRKGEIAVGLAAGITRFVDERRHPNGRRRGAWRRAAPLDPDDGHGEEHDERGQRQRGPPRPAAHPNRGGPPPPRAPAAPTRPPAPPPR